MSRWRLVPILVVALAIAVWNAPEDPVGASPKRTRVLALRRSAAGRPVVADGIADAELRWGAAFFEEAARWVEGGGSRVDRVESFHCRLDAKFEVESHRLEGQLRFWYGAPDAYRQERTTHAGTTTHILAGGRGWLIHPDGQVEDLSASRSGRDELADTRETRDRLVDVVSAITLRPLQQGTSSFSFAGYKRGSGTYAGNWIKLVRRAAGPRRVLCRLAYDRSDLDEVHPTWPGIVRIEDEGERGAWTEDLILTEWNSPFAAARTGRRFPRRIDAYAIDESDGRRIPWRLLFAILEDLQVNVPLDERLFGPPAEGE